MVRPKKKPDGLDISIEYRGAAVKGGRMNGRLVAQEILGFCNYASLAGEMIFGRDVEVQPEVRGFRGGSFDIDFIVELLGTVATIHSMSPTDPKELLGLIKDSITLFKHVRGEKPKRASRSKVHNHVEVENNKGNIQVFNIDTINFATDPAVASAAQDFIVKPLQSGGVASVEIVSKQMRGKLASITKQHVNSFVPLSTDRPLLESEHDTGLLIDSPSFREGNKWRFYDGQAGFTAAIEDEDFLKAIDEGQERFGKGDVLVVTMRVRQVRTADGGLRAERTILKVKEHKVAQRQCSLLDKD